METESRHLVLYPTRFLEGEDISNNFLFNADRYVAVYQRAALSDLRLRRLLPLPIYD